MSGARTDAHGVRCVGRDILEFARFIQFLTHYAPISSHST